MHLLQRRIIALFLLIIILASISPTNRIFAQSDDSVFRAKSTVTGEQFNGGKIWTAINGDKATTITQWSLGRSLIHSTVAASTECESAYPICFEATISDAINNAAVKPGDKFLIGIDPENKKQVIIGKEIGRAHV